MRMLWNHHFPQGRRGGWEWEGSLNLMRCMTAGAKGELKSQVGEGVPRKMRPAVEVWQGWYLPAVPERGIGVEALPAAVAVTTGCRIFARYWSNKATS